MALVLLALGCASGPRPQAETAARVKDSAPERIAAQRAAVRGLDLEQDDQRWGFEAARERRRRQDQDKQASGKSSEVDPKYPAGVRQAAPPRATP